jgi:hypothetical protein
LQQLGFCTSNGYVSISYLAPVAVTLTGAGSGTITLR